MPRTTRAIQIREASAQPELDSVTEAVEKIGEASLGILDSQLSLARLELAQGSRELAQGLGWSALALFFVALGWVATLAAVVIGLAPRIDLALLLGGVGILHLLLALAARRAATKHADEVAERLEP